MRVSTARLRGQLALGSLSVAESIAHVAGFCTSRLVRWSRQLALARSFCTAGRSRSAGTRRPLEAAEGRRDSARATDARMIVFDEPAQRCRVTMSMLYGAIDVLRAAASPSST